MVRSAGGLLRDNAFLVAAVSLPVLVVGFFLLSTVLPRFIVPPPAYDLLLRASAYDQAAPRIAVDFAVRDDRVQATVRPAPPNSYPSRVSLWLFDHATLNVRQVPLDLPDRMADDEPPRTIVIDALADRRVVAQTRAPDGYELRTRTGSSPGLVGDLFGMRRYSHDVSLVHRGRVVPIAMPAPHELQLPAVVAWVIDDGRR